MSAGGGRYHQKSRAGTMHRFVGLMRLKPILSYYESQKLHEILLGEPQYDLVVYAMHILRSEI